MVNLLKSCGFARVLPRRYSYPKVPLCDSPGTAEGFASASKFDAGTMFRHFPSAILILLLITAACGQEDSTELRDEAPVGDAVGPAGADRSPETDPLMDRTADCVNDLDHYSIEYPADWHVNSGDILNPCSLFDPDSIVVPENSEIPVEIAVSIDFEPVDFATLTEDALGRRDLSRESATIDRREAVRIEGESTGAGLFEPGLRSYQYFIDLGDTTVIASTYDAGTLPFERKCQILDAMMATLDLLDRH